LSLNQSKWMVRFDIFLCELRKKRGSKCVGGGHILPNARDQPAFLCLKHTVASYLCSIYIPVYMHVLCVPHPLLIIALIRLLQITLLKLASCIHRLDYGFKKHHYEEFGLCNAASNRMHQETYQM
jgi:hypothetical protein